MKKSILVIIAILALTSSVFAIDSGKVDPTLKNKGVTALEIYPPKKHTVALEIKDPKKQEVRALEIKSPKRQEERVLEIKPPHLQ